MEDDYPTGTSGTFSVSQSQTGSFDTPSDVDTFEIRLQTGFTYRLDVEATSASVDPFFDLYEPFDIYWGSDDDTGDGTNARIEITVTSTGIYRLDVVEFSGLTGTYSVSATVTEAPFTTGDDYPESTSGELLVGGSQTGNIETMNDTDAFSIFLEAGYTYRFDLEGQDTGAGTLFDPAFYIGNSLGNEQVYDDDSGTGLNARIIDFTPATSGYHFLYAYVDDRDLTGTYRLSATQTASPTPTTPTMISLQAGDFAVDEGANTCLGSQHPQNWVSTPKNGSENLPTIGMESCPPSPPLQLVVPLVGLAMSTRLAQMRHLVAVVHHFAAVCSLALVANASFTSGP